MFGKKSSKVTAPVVQTRVIYRSSPEDVSMQNRVNAFISKSYDEYARLTFELEEYFDKCKSGLATEEDVRRAQRQMSSQSTIIDSLAIITGGDSIVLGFQLERSSRKRVEAGEVFPYTSYLSSSSPIFPPVTV